MEALEAYARAEACLSKDAQSKQSDWLVMIANNRGNTLRAMKHYEQAVQAYEQSVTLAPGNAGAWQYLAATYLQWVLEARERDEREVRLQAGLHAVEQALQIVPYNQQAQQLQRLLVADLAQLHRTEP